MLPYDKGNFEMALKLMLIQCPDIKSVLNTVGRFGPTEETLLLLNYTKKNSIT